MTDSVSASAVSAPSIIEPRITDAAARKLASISGDFLALTPEEQLALIRETRSRRLRPRAPLTVKAPKVAKALKDPSAKKPRAKKLIKAEATTAKENLHESLEAPEGSEKPNQEQAGLEAQTPHEREEGDPPETSAQDSQA